MKKVYTFFALLFMAGLTYAQVEVTFRVDMSVVGASDNGVFVTGNWMDDAGLGGEWQEPGSNQSARLTDDDEDGVYTLTVTLPAGTYQFKYANGAGWPNAEAGGGGDNYQADLSGCGGTDNGFGGYNRNMTVPADDSYELPAYEFNSCNLSTSISEPISTIKGIRIAPNPVIATSQIVLDNPTFTPHNLLISDMTGKVVKMIPNVLNVVEISRGDLAPGLYFATFRNDKGETITSKLLVH